MKWTIEEKRKGRSLSKCTPALSHAAIADFLNKEFHDGQPVRSAKAVRSRRFNPLLRAVVPTAAIEALRALVEEGLTAAEIGTQMRITRNTVIGRCNRAGIPLNDSRQLQADSIRATFDTPEPLSLHTPYEPPTCKFMGLDIDHCDKSIIAGSYCADHYILSRGDKDRARETIERLTNKETT